MAIVCACNAPPVSDMTGLVKCGSARLNKVLKDPLPLPTLVRSIVPLFKKVILSGVIAAACAATEAAVIVPTGRPIATAAVSAAVIPAVFASANG